MSLEIRFCFVVAVFGIFCPHSLVLSFLAAIYTLFVTILSFLSGFNRSFLLFSLKCLLEGGAGAAVRGDQHLNQLWTLNGTNTNTIRLQTKMNSIGKSRIKQRNNITFDVYVYLFTTVHQINLFFKRLRVFACVQVCKSYGENHLSMLYSLYIYIYIISSIILSPSKNLFTFHIIFCMSFLFVWWIFVNFSQRT